MTERDVTTQVEQAQSTALRLANIDTVDRDVALGAITDAIRDSSEAVLAVNRKDIEEAEAMLVTDEYTQAFVDHLKLDEVRLGGIAGMVESVVEQGDPFDETLEACELDEDLKLYKPSVPVGVMAIIFESWPDALAQIATLALESGNAVILKGGSEVSESNRVLYETILSATEELPDDWAMLIEAHEKVDHLSKLDDMVDLMIPRDSSELASHIQNNTQIPVLGRTEGTYHVYIDEAADLDVAIDIAFDAKVQYPTIYNAVETLLVDESVVADLLPTIVKHCCDKGVALRGDEATREHVDIDSATDDGWNIGYDDLELSVKVVPDLYDAVDHINVHSSKYIESIVTNDAKRAEMFTIGVGAVSVFHNASTRFADDYRYSLGVEVGISMDKIHARGSIGLEGLTACKCYLEDDGQLVATRTGKDAVPSTYEMLDAD